MNISAVKTNELNLDDISVSSPIRRVFSSIAQFNVALQKANKVHKQARQLYATTDTDLAELGISREEISAHLSKEYNS